MKDIKINIFFLVFSFLTTVSCREHAENHDSSEILKVESFKQRISSAVKSGEYDKVILFCDSILIISPEDSWALLKKGMALQLTGRNSEAIIVLNKLVDLSTSINSEAYFWRANSKEALGDTIGAIADHTVALIFDSTYANSYNNRGQIYKYQRKYELAIKDLSTAIYYNPTQVLTYNNLGNVYADCGKPDSALNAYSRGLAIQETDYLYFDRAILKFKLKKYEEAIIDFNSASRLNKANPLIYIYRGHCYSWLDKTDLMCNDYLTASQLGSKEGTECYQQACGNTRKL